MTRFSAKYLDWPLGSVVSDVVKLGARADGRKYSPCLDGRRSNYELKLILKTDQVLQSKCEYCHRVSNELPYD